MNTFLHARFNEAQRRYLAQCAYMQETNLAFAEKKGGVDALTGADKARFEGIQGRLIDLVAFNDATEEYIDSLHDILDDLLQERKSLRAQIVDLTGDKPLPPPVPYREWLGLMVLGTGRPTRLAALLDAQEGRRQALQNALEIEMPNLFSKSA